MFKITNKKDLIYDNGKLRNCISNKAKLNVFELVSKRPDIYGYASIFKEFVSAFSEIVPRLIDLIGGVFVFPFLPLLQAYFVIKRAKKEMKKNEKL